MPTRANEAARRVPPAEDLIGKSSQVRETAGNEGEKAFYVSLINASVKSWDAISIMSLSEEPWKVAIGVLYRKKKKLRIQFIRKETY